MQARERHVADEARGLRPLPANLAIPGVARFSLTDLCSSSILLAMNFTAHTIATIIITAIAARAGLSLVNR